jgi:hypothetical protein
MECKAIFLSNADSSLSGTVQLSEVPPPLKKTKKQKKEKNKKGKKKRKKQRKL